MSCSFDLSHINWSWGFQHNGVIIDSTGRVIAYDVTPLKNPQISMPEKIQHGKQMKQLSILTMDRLCMLLKIYNAAKSNIDAKLLKNWDEDARDAGATRYYGYLGSSQVIQIPVYGPFHEERKGNLDRNTLELIEFLNDIYKLRIEYLMNRGEGS